MAEEGRHFWHGFAPDTTPTAGERAMPSLGMPSQGGYGTVPDLNPARIIILISNKFFC